jgi:hypothetical protein
MISHSKWREGDPVGMGEVYLPDAKDKQAYSLACKRLIIESAALPRLEVKYNRQTQGVYQQLYIGMAGRSKKQGQ